MATVSSQNVTLPIIPELYEHNFLDILLPPPIPTESTANHPVHTHPMLTALLSTANQTLTTNNAAAYSSTLSPTLDAFMRLLSCLPPDLDDLLSKSWADDPALTLRIIWNLRSIHNGKGAKEPFYRAFGWLYDHHPRTAITNLALLVDPVCTRPNTDQGLSHGYWKDLLNISVLALTDQLGQKPAEFLHHQKQPFVHKRFKIIPDGDKNPKITQQGDPAARIAANLKEGIDAKAAAKTKRALKATEHHDRLLTKLAEPKFKALYIAIARTFSHRLVKDLALLQKFDTLPPGPDRFAISLQVSLAAKWAPTPHGSHDRYTNLSTAIGLLLHRLQDQIHLTFPPGFSTSLDPAETHALRHFCQRWVLTPLRKLNMIPEPLMSTGRWKEIKYTRVSATSMKMNMESFFKHDQTRFEEYLLDVEKGKKTISGATLFPHEIVAQAMALSNPTTENGKWSESYKLAQQQFHDAQMRVVEGQWKSLIQRLRESGAIQNAVAVCDVSGSMGSISAAVKKGREVPPILPAVSLSLVLAQLAKPPFDNGFITFSHAPKFVRLDPSKGLVENVRSMSTADWAMNTDLDAVFLKLLLPLAIKNNVSREDMIKRLFVFSDMQFDEGESNGRDPANWETNHDVYVKRFQEAGYDLPEIVYWNLHQDSQSALPVTADRKGVALMNGFSPAMLKVFMGEGEEGESWEDVTMEGDTKTVVSNDASDPVSVMKKALLKPSFDGLVVVD